MFQHKLSNLFKCGALLLSILCLSQQSVLSQCTFSASVQGSAGATTKYYLTNTSGVVVDDTAPLTAPSVDVLPSILFLLSADAVVLPLR